MDTKEIFSAALQLESPWYIQNIAFTTPNENTHERELHIYLAFDRGSHFHCPVDSCNEQPTAYDTKPRTWRHLNFFQYKTFLHASLPRVSCKNHGVKTVSVPWARSASGFTLLFESWVLELAKYLPVSEIASLVDEHDTRLWRFIRDYVEEARTRENFSGVEAVGMDETSKKGHNYITVAVDLKERKVIYVTNGKDSSTVDRFTQDFKEHGGNPDKVGVITCDMSLGFRKGIKNNFQNSHVVIDKFHVIKHANEGVDEVRKMESKENGLLRRTKYIWLKNESSLTDKQREKKESLLKKRLRTGRAYAMRVALQDVYSEVSREGAESRLKKLCSWMMHSRLEPMKKLTKMLREHWEEILNYFDYPYTNAILEGMNSIIQNIKCRARGFRNDEYFKTMIYLVCGKLDLAACAL